MGDVSTEDPAQYMELVDDDEPEAVQERGPTGVVRQQRCMQHLGIGEHHIRVAAHPPARLGAGVAVVGRGDEARNRRVGEGAQLILREGLCWIDEQSRPRRAIADRLRDG